MAPLGGVDIVEIKTIGDALKLARRWQLRAEELERDYIELRQRAAKAYREVANERDTLRGVIAATAYDDLPQEGR